MERLIVARHAESEFSAVERVNGDPTVAAGLTDRGRDEARALGAGIADERVDLCAVTEFTRTRETAELALAGRDVQTIVVPELNEIAIGRFEGGPLSEYRVWARGSGPTAECPGGGESRVAAATRFARGFRLLLDRPEPTILLVAHGLPVRYLLTALDGGDPTAILEPVPHAEPYRVARDALERAVGRLERWCARPVWAA